MANTTTESDSMEHERNAANEALWLAETMTDKLSGFIQRTADLSGESTEHAAVQNYHFFNNVASRLVDGSVKVGGDGVSAMTTEEYAEAHGHPDVDMWTDDVEATINVIRDRVNVDWDEHIPEKFTIEGVAKTADDVFVPIIDGEPYNPGHGMDAVLADGYTVIEEGDDDAEERLHQDMLADLRSDDGDDEQVPEVEAEVVEPEGDEQLEDDRPEAVRKRENTVLPSFIDFETLEVMDTPDNWQVLDNALASFILSMQNPARTQREIASMVQEKTGNSYTKTSVGNSVARFLTDEEQGRFKTRQKDARAAERDAGEEMGEEAAVAATGGSAAAVADEPADDTSDTSGADSHDDEPAEVTLDDVHYQKLRSAASKLGDVGGHPDKDTSIDIIQQHAGFAVEIDDTPEVRFQLNGEDVDIETYLEETEAPEEAEGVEVEGADELAEAMVAMSDGRTINPNNALSGAIQSLSKQGDEDALYTIFSALRRTNGSD